MRENSRQLEARERGAAVRGRGAAVVARRRGRLRARLIAKAACFLHDLRVTLRGTRDGNDY